MSSEPEAKMERREGNAVTLRSVYNASIPGYPTYRPFLACRRHRFYAVPPYHQQLLERTRGCVRIFRIFCVGLLGFVLVLLLCLSPLHWVRFIVLKDRKRLWAGLWTLCHRDLCWSHTPVAPYYLQYSRAFFLISALTILIIITWFSILLTKGPGDKTYIDLGISIVCFISGTCLLLCLILFLMQVKFYSKNVMEPHFLLVYHLNWWGSVFYMIVGFFSGCNYIRSRVSSSDQNRFVIPITRTRIGNIATVELGLTETNVDVSSRKSQAPERQSSSGAQSRTQTEAGAQTEAGTQKQQETQTGPETPKVLGTQAELEAQAELRMQTEPETGNESAVRDGLITHVRLANAIIPVDTVEPRPEAEITTGNVTSDTGM